MVRHCLTWKLQARDVHVDDPRFTFYGALPLKGAKAPGGSARAGVDGRTAPTANSTARLLEELQGIQDRLEQGPRR